MSVATPNQIAPLVMLLSFRHRDRLAVTLEELGASVIAARRSEGIVERFTASGAAIMIVDARDAPIEALNAVEALGPTVKQQRGTLVLLLSKVDTDMLPAFEQAGISHFLSAPFRNSELAAITRLARRAARPWGTRSGDSERLRAGEDVGRALADDEIRIFYQPQFEMVTNRLVGAEALARWHHPQFGMVGVNSLLAAGDLTGKKQEISARIRALVCADIARWNPRLCDIGVALNIVAEDLLDPGFSAEFLAQLDAHTIPHARMTLEITEGSFVRNFEQAGDVLVHLREAGVRIAVDDFGTGYSSLSYLKSLPVDYLKIDSSLSRDIAGSERERIVVQAVIDLAHSLRLDVVAEGVETEEQLALLTEQGCRYWQGFLKSGAVTSDELLQFL